MVIINCQWNCIQASVLKKKSSDHSLRKEEEEKDRIIFKNFFDALKLSGDHSICNLLIT